MENYPQSLTVLTQDLRDLLHLVDHLLRLLLQLVVDVLRAAYWDAIANETGGKSSIQLNSSPLHPVELRRGQLPLAVELCLVLLKVEPAPVSDLELEVAEGGSGHL